MLLDSHKIFMDFHDLPENIKGKIKNVTLTMSQGMCEFCQQGKVKIKNLSKLNWYCFFVAGIVGELLTDLVAENSDEFKVNKQTYQDSYHFGLFLQKINLLKDQRVDESEGRYFIYNRLEVLASLREHYEASLSYLKSIPLSLKSYRLFCAWSLALGVCSLPYIEKSYIQKSNIKISRFETKMMVLMVESIIGSPQILDDFLSKLFRSNGVFEHSNTSVPKGLSRDYSSLYVGEHFSDDIQGSLGLI